MATDNINFISFSQTSEWLKIVQHLEEVKKDYLKDMILEGEAGNIHRMTSLAGKCSMIDEFIGLPTYLGGVYRPIKGVVANEG